MSVLSRPGSDGVTLLDVRMFAFEGRCCVEWSRQSGLVGPEPSARAGLLFDLFSAMGYNAACQSAGCPRAACLLISSSSEFEERGSTTLANTKSAIKRIRSSERKRKINQVHRSRARTYVKIARTLIEAGQLDEGEVMALKAMRALDKAAQKGVIHKNNAARRKARLMKALNQARVQAA